MADKNLSLSECMRKFVEAGILERLERNETFACAIVNIRHIFEEVKNVNRNGMFRIKKIFEDRRNISRMR